MKKFLIYLILILLNFSVSTYADDVRDFEIEGITIGDSLLDHFSKNEIKNFTITTYQNKTDEYIMLTGAEDKSQEYDSLSFHVKKNDNQEYRFIKKIVSDLNINFIDIDKEVFKKEKYPLKLFPFELSGHYTIDGYRKVGEAIFNNVH